MRGKDKLERAGTLPPGMRINLPEPLHAFVALVLDDAALQARLAAEVETDAFVAACLACARAAGCDVEGDAIAAALRPRPLGRSQSDAPLEADRWPPTGWLPAWSAETSGAPDIDWLWLETSALHQPFFADAVRQARVLPFNRLFRIRTSLAALADAAAEEKALPLAGLIYHMSRCGSTLVARLLMDLPGNVVASEPEPFDAVVRWATTADRPVHERLAALRAMAQALGRRRSANQERFAIKLDSWHALSLPLIRAAFPETPWVLLHRNPAEILASHRRIPGMQAVPGLLPKLVTGIAEPERLGREEYLALLLARLAVATKGALADGGLAVDYADLAGGGFARILTHFGLAPGEAALAALAPVWADDAKEPGRAWAGPASMIRPGATPD